jgi:hypothetical protein
MEKQSWKKEQKKALKKNKKSRMSNEKVDSEDARANYSGNVEEEESTVNRSDVAGNPMEASLTGHESIVGSSQMRVTRSDEQKSSQGELGIDSKSPSDDEDVKIEESDEEPSSSETTPWKEESVESEIRPTTTSSTSKKRKPASESNDLVLPEPKRNATSGAKAGSRFPSVSGLDCQNEIETETNKNFVSTSSRKLLFSARPCIV